jgi:dihydrolipoamide dehydrogenase
VKPRASTVTIIGGGPGGYVAAIRAAALGLRVTLVESGALGGTCLNVGCIPSKALLHAAEQRRHALRTTPGIGLSVGPVDMGALQTWKSGVVDRLRGGVGGLLRGAGVVVLQGSARLAGEGIVLVDGPSSEQTLEADAVVLATGASPVEIPSLPVDGARVLSSTEALELQYVPKHVAIVGAGYIGLELATALHGLGARVTVLEASDRVLPGVHAAAAAIVAESLTDEGIDIRLGVSVESDDGLRLRFSSANGTQEALEVDRIVTAVGRRPRSEGLGLETVGIVPEQSGVIAVDDWCRTTASGVYAIGDLTPGPALAHRASAQGELVAEHLAGGDLAFRPAAIPAVVYTSPELATVGLTAEAAHEMGVPAVEHRFPFVGNARALIQSGERGAAYVVSDPGSDRLLGVHLVGDGVGEMIGAAAVAIEMGAVLADVGDTIFPHPTVSEAVREAVAVARGRPLHAAGASGKRHERRGDR